MSSALWNHSSPPALSSSQQLAEAVSAAISSSYSCICKEASTTTPSSSASKWHARICRCGSNGSATAATAEGCNCQPFDLEFQESSATPSSTYSQSDGAKDEQLQQGRNRSQKSGSRFRIFRTWRQQHKQQQQHCPVHHNHQKTETCADHCDQQSNLLTKSTWIAPLSSAEQQPAQQTSSTAFEGGESAAAGGGDSSLSFSSLIQGKSTTTMNGNTAL